MILDSLEKGLHAHAQTPTIVVVTLIPMREAHSGGLIPYVGPRRQEEEGVWIIYGIDSHVDLFWHSSTSLMRSPRHCCSSTTRT